MRIKSIGLAALAATPFVAFEADGRVAGAPDEAWSVVIKGSSEEVRGRRLG